MFSALESRENRFIELVSRCVSRNRDQEYPQFTHFGMAQRVRVLGQRLFLGAAEEEAETHKVGAMGPVLHLDQSNRDFRSAGGNRSEIRWEMREEGILVQAYLFSVRRYVWGP